MRLQTRREPEILLYPGIQGKEKQGFRAFATEMAAFWEVGDAARSDKSGEHFLKRDVPHLRQENSFHSILPARTTSRTAKMRFSVATGNRWVVFAPSGAASMLNGIIHNRAGR